MPIRDHILDTWGKYATALVISVSIGGLAAAADSRWLKQTSFQEWVEEDRRQEISAEIRQLDRQINRAESEAALSDDPVEEAVLQERIKLLEEQQADLERELD